MKLFAEKRAKQDYTESMLPHNRREVFFDVLKLNFKAFLLYGLLMFICCLPLIFLSVNKLFAYSDMSEAISAAADADKTALVWQSIQTLNIFALLEGAAFVPVFLYLAGLVRVIRQYAWGEPVFFRVDFAAGFKSNWLQMLILGIIFGAFYSISVCAYNSAQLMGDGAESYLMMAPLGAFIFVCVPMAACAMSAVSVYANKLGGTLKIAFYIVFTSPFATLLALFCCALPFALLLIPDFTCALIFRALIALIFPIILLGWMLFTFNRFDKYINSAHFPELVGRGMAVSDKRTDQTRQSYGK